MANIRSAATVFLGFVLGGLNESGSLFVASLVIFEGELLLQLTSQLHENLLYVIAIFG